MTRAPARLARSAVPSTLPPSATITSSITWRGIEATTPSIDSASFKVGITTAILNEELLEAGDVPISQAPTETAIFTSSRRPTRHQSFAKVAIGATGPNLFQRLLV